MDVEFLCGICTCAMVPKFVPPMIEHPYPSCFQHFWKAKFIPFTERYVICLNVVQLSWAMRHARNRGFLKWTGAIKEYLVYIYTYTNIDSEMDAMDEDGDGRRTDVDGHV